MSVDWDFSYLIHPNSLTRAQMESIVEVAGDIGLRPMPGEHGGIYGMAADGTKSTEFQCTDELLEWLDKADGLFSLRGGSDDLELSVSIRRTDGSLQEMMRELPDEPRFEVCTVSVGAWTFERGGREERWRRLDLLLQAFSSVLAPSLVSGMSEEAAEAEAGFQCVHQAVAADQLPPAIGWMTEVHRHSALASQLKAAAEAISRPLTVHHDHLRLQLTDVPWSSSLAATQEASELIRLTLGTQMPCHEN